MGVWVGGRVYKRRDFTQFPTAKIYWQWIGQPHWYNKIHLPKSVHSEREPTTTAFKVKITNYNCHFIDVQVPIQSKISSYWYKLEKVFSKEINTMIYWQMVETVVKANIYVYFLIAEYRYQGKSYIPDRNLSRPVRNLCFKNTSAFHHTNSAAIRFYHQR